MGLRQGPTGRFVKHYAQIAQVLEQAAATYVEEVASGTFPGPEHTFTDPPTPRAVPADQPADQPPARLPA